MLAPVTPGKTLLDRIEERRLFPSNSAKWCTSDLKRGPIERELRRYLIANPRFEGRLVSAMGLRRDESAAQAKRLPWKRNDHNSRAGRQWFDWVRPDDQRCPRPIPLAPRPPPLPHRH